MHDGGFSHATQFPNLRGETQDTANFRLHEYLGDSWGIIFMHPADFTPVCTTELGAAQSLLSEFTLRDVKLCGFSCDDAIKHRDWISDIEVATGSKITFPLFCDPTRTHAIELGVLDPKLKDDDGMPLTVRAVYILNPQKEIMLTMTYPSSVGRNFDEILRTVDALQRAAKFGVATPANWQPGDKTIVSLEMDDKAATNVFGKVKFFMPTIVSFLYCYPCWFFATSLFFQNGYATVKLPSERGKHVRKHYLRYTDDPLLKEKSQSKQSFKLASSIGKTISWRPPKSFSKLSNRRSSDGSDVQSSSTTVTSTTEDNTQKIESNHINNDIHNDDNKRHGWPFFTRGFANNPHSDTHEMCMSGNRGFPSKKNECNRSSLPPKKSPGLLLDFNGKEEQYSRSKLRSSLPTLKSPALILNFVDEEEKQNRSELCCSMPSQKTEAELVFDDGEENINSSIVWWNHIFLLSYLTVHETSDTCTCDVKIFAFLGILILAIGSE